MRTEYRDDPTVDTADLPYGWHKGDTCVMITNKAKKSTSEYIVESYDGVYFGVRSHTGLSSHPCHNHGEGYISKFDMAS